MKRLVASWPDGESTLLAGEVLAVVAHLEKPLVSDGQAESAMLSRAMAQGAAIGTGVAVFGFIAIGNVISDTL